MLLLLGCKFIDKFLSTIFSTNGSARAVNQHAPYAEIFFNEIQINFYFFVIFISSVFFASQWLKKKIKKIFIFLFYASACFYFLWNHFSFVKRNIVTKILLCAVHVPN